PDRVRSRLLRSDPASLRAAHRPAGQARRDRAELRGGGRRARPVTHDGRGEPPMTFGGKKPRTNEQEVGYGKPPMHTRFRKGQSGNPGGRPRGMTAGKATALALKEAYRPVN